MFKLQISGAVTLTTAIGSDTNPVFHPIDVLFVIQKISSRVSRSSFRPR